MKLGEIDKESPSLPSGRVRAGWLALVLLFLAIIGMTMAVYFTLRPDSRFVTAGFFPHSIAQWADNHGQFRNFPAYVLLTLVLILAAAGRERVRGTREAGETEPGKLASWLLRERGVEPRCWQIALALLVFSAGLEFMQLGISTRLFEWADIWWSWAGVFGGWCSWEGWTFASKRLHG